MNSFAEKIIEGENRMSFLKNTMRIFL